MSSNRARRVAKELADIHADTLSHIAVEPVDNGDGLMHLKGSFKGPPGTPYEGGTYKIDIRIPGEYPFRPPVMKFDTKVWHPNVSSQTVSKPSFLVILINAGSPDQRSRVLYVSIPFLPLGLPSSLSSPLSYRSNHSSVLQSQRILRMRKLLAC